MVFFSFFFFRHVFGVDSLPILEYNCTSEQYFDTYSYICDSITDDMSGVFQNGSLSCTDAQMIDLSSSTPSCASYVESDSTVQFNGFYYQISSSASQLSTTAFTLHSLSEEYQININGTFLEDLNNSIKICSSNASSIFPSCQMLASTCSLFHYDQNCESCIKFNEIFPTTAERVNGYEFWTANMPFISYQTGTRALQEQVLISDYQYSQVIEIELAKFSQTGDFQGFIKMKDQFRHCGEMKYLNQIWRFYGTGVNEECNFNFQTYVQQGDTSFYEPFLVEIVNSTKILRPIPILDMNYRDANGNAVNQGTTERNHRAFRRFFLFDNYTNDVYYQYLSNLTLVFQTGGEYPYLPYFVTSYDIVEKNVINSTEIDILNMENSPVMVRSIFRASFRTDLDDFWFAALVVVVVLASLLFILFLYKCYLSYLRFGQDGMNAYVIIQCVFELMTIVSILSFILCFIFSFAVLIAYKWNRTTSFMLPEEEVFSILQVFMWLCFASSALALLTKILMMNNTNIIFIEWKYLKFRGKNETYRKVMIANEWLKLLTLRDYNIPFILITIVFMMDGFNLNLVATPIQSNKLVDTGINSSVLRFPFVCLLWICLYLIQFIFFKIKDLIFGSPINDFLNLCGTANISIFSFISKSWGFYIHGRSLVHDDEENISLDSMELGATEEIVPDVAKSPGSTMRNQENNQSTMLSTIGSQRRMTNDSLNQSQNLSRTQTIKPYHSVYLDDDQPQQNFNAFGTMVFNNDLAASAGDSIFEFFLAPPFREQFDKVYQPVLEVNKSVNIKTAADQDAVIPQAMAVFVQMNSFLKRFFGADERMRDFDIYQPPAVVTIFGLPHPIDQRSLAYIVNRRKFAQTTTYNIQWIFALFDMMLFAGIDYEIQKPTIAAFATFFIDFFLCKLINLIGQSNLKKKTLVEKRFYL